MVDFTKVSREDLQTKNLGELIGDMISLVIQEPRVVDHNFLQPLRGTYLLYNQEISRREIEIYSKGGYSDTLLRPRF
ncbi:MAG: hypothetical protein AABW50_04380 [Nanoarchaeota archaeon]